MLSCTSMYEHSAFEVTPNFPTERPKLEVVRSEISSLDSQINTIDSQMAGAQARLAHSQTVDESQDSAVVSEINEYIMQKSNLMARKQQLELEQMSQ